MRLFPGWVQWLPGLSTGCLATFWWQQLQEVSCLPLLLTYMLKYAKCLLVVASYLVYKHESDLSSNPQETVSHFQKCWTVLNCFVLGWDGWHETNVLHQPFGVSSTATWTWSPTGFPSVITVSCVWLGYAACSSARDATKSWRSTHHVNR